MKKLYALSVALLAAGSMLASNPAAIKPEARQASQLVEMSQEGQAMLRAEQAYQNYITANEISMPGAQKFSWTDAQGESWTATLMESGKWTDNFTSWDGAKYYGKMSCSISNGKSGSDRNYINYIMFYPRYSMWNESAWSQLFPGEDAAADKILPLKYCMKGSTIMSANWPQGWYVPEATATANNFYIGGTSTTGGSEADALVIMNSNTKLSSGQPYFTNGSMGYCYYKGVACGAAKGSSLQLSNFDSETSSIDMAFKGTCTNAAGTTIWTYSMDYSGEANLFGLASAPASWTATCVHIVNTGSVTGEDVEYADIDDNEWGPFQRFYVLACGEGYTYDQVALSSGGNLWTSTAIPSGPARTVDNAPDLQNLRGALFSANGATDVNNVWYEANVQVAFDNLNMPMTTGRPSLNSFLYANVNSNYWAWGQTDGMRSSYKGFYFYLPYAVTDDAKGTYNPFVMLGTTAGFGYKGLSTYNCTYTVSYKGNVVYHYDPTDYLKTKTVPAVGTLAPGKGWDGVEAIFNDGENNFNVNAANGMINVAVENAAMVNVYNMAGMIVKSVKANAGQTVNVEVANGIYIVKVGAKSVKVAL